MTRDDVNAACREIRTELEGRVNIGAPARDPNGKTAEHLLWMLHQVLFKADFSDNKAQRWYGYIQAGLVFTGNSTLEHEKNRSRLHSLAGNIVRAENTEHARRNARENRTNALVRARELIAAEDAADRDSDFTPI